ncbi:MAG TPA: ABC transporter substrate-binding protein [Chloroflexota bacterium]|nr:ABC transporter substrate-binding protein [Chloroflexota bacterium]
MTRRGFIGRAAATAGTLSALGTAVLPNVAQAGVVQQARVNGRLQVVQAADCNSDHNAFVKKTIEEYAASQNWQLDLSDLAGFLGGSDVYQKFQAQKAAGQPVDFIVHQGLNLRLMNLYDLVRDATPVINRAVQRYGRTTSGAQIDAQIDNKWIGVPFFDRTDGYWIRADKAAENGFYPETGSFDTWQGVFEAAKAMSRPSEGFYGWGMTTNRSGDGEYLMWRVIHAWGGALTDPTGNIVTFYSPETIDAVSWLADVYLNSQNQNMFPPGVNAWNDLSNNEAFLAGSIGVTSNGGTLFASARYNKNPVADVTAFLPNPLGPYGVRIASSGASYMYFMNGATNYDAAAQLAEHLLTEPVQRQLYTVSSGYAVPAWDALWNTPEIQADSQVSLKFKVISQADPAVSGNSYRGPTTDASSAALFQQFATDMFGEVLAGKPVEQAVRETHIRVVGIYNQMGVRGR